MMSSNILLYAAYIIISHILQTYGRPLKICDDAYECQKKSLVANKIECSGYGGCDSATISSKGSNGYIECTGSNGCNEAKSLLCTKNILCQGHRSCFGSGKITAGKILQCSGSQSCSGCDIATSAGNILCGGWESCKKCELVAENDVECDGLSSCSSTSITTKSDILCRGNKACIGTKLTSENKIECSGNVACKRAKISAKKVTFSGTMAGDGAKIVGDKEEIEIEGGGYNSLNLAEIDSGNSTNMKVKLSSTSGKDTVILARSGTDLSVECEDACSETAVLSFAGSNTTVTVNTGGGGGGVDCSTAPNDPSCPKIEESLDPCEDVKLFQSLQHRRNAKYMKYMNHIVNEYEYNTENYNMEWYDLLHEIYGINNDAVKCESLLSCDSEPILNENAQCFAAQSCSSAQINQTEQGDIYDTQCFGELSCNQALLYNKYGNIKCDGKESCLATTYIAAKFTTCRGYSACQSSKGGIHTNSLDCEASFSCANNVIKNKLNVRCLANRACFQSNVIAGKSILCDGSNSCAEGVINSTDGTVKCSGSYSCSKSEIYAKVYVYADGDNAATNSRIISPVVRGYGYKSLSQSVIDSNYLGKLSLKLYGNLTGYSSTIICRSGDVCSLKCEATGCKGVTYVCMGASADCKVTPVACANDVNRNKTKGREGVSFGKVVAGVNCPVITTQIPETILLFKELYPHVISDNNNKMEENSNMQLKFVGGFCVFIIAILILIGSLYYYKLRYKEYNNYYESII